MMASRKAILTEYKEALNENKKELLQSLILNNLWILDENLIYYKEKPKDDLLDFQINNEFVFDINDLAKFKEKYNFPKEFKGYISFFLNESKCAIVVFRNLIMPIEKYVLYINRFSFFIKNHLKKELAPKIFNIYTITDPLQEFEERDLYCSLGNYDKDEKMKCLYREFGTVADLKDQWNSGNKYSEIISYESIIERATKRLEILTK